MNSKGVLNREKFKVAAERGVRNVEVSFGTLAKLANTGRYSYSTADVKTIMAYLRSEIDMLEERFAQARKPKSQPFKL